MTRQFSFVKYENEVLPEYRDRLNKAESSEDVRNTFAYMVQELFRRALDGRDVLEFDDVVLAPDTAEGYSMSEQVMAREEIASLWEDSDLGRVLGDLADSAQKRIIRLEKHEEKTDSKIRN
ncbi:hypothetical protein GGQ74_001458 [Desulfobaculum xiamenense]|uniref:Uncharacterized protein n=1 Tax=Desulfobaculum xiamenense TaxID=995050 RepID=A0A846QHT1_9BACT|nr:hypothetical protein [Desulfobaculum xiamenense]NJB67818.1 hypothetical protein [Desulfobaculum xiamenense]